YRNLTGTRSPGAGPGACDDEDYMTACPKVVNDSIFVTYVEDKDAGGWPQTEGVLTENPVRCWVFDKSWVGIEEHNNNVQVTTALNLYPNPAANGSAVSYTLARSGNVSLNLFDAAGRFISNLATGNKVAGTYNVDIDARELANGTYFVILDTPIDKVSRSLVIMH
ncbi:MAG: T9SS type A sorting domain-containing protein, partial [bacterium]